MMSQADTVPVPRAEFALGKTTILVGDCRQGMRTLPAKSIHAVVTSPPYFGLRDYGTGQWEGGEPGCKHQTRQDSTRVKMVASSTLQGGKGSTGHQQEGYGRRCARCGAARVDRQIGLEASVSEYIDTMVDVFTEVWRVLRDDGICLLNIGDSYAGSGKGPTGTNGVGNHETRQGFAGDAKRGNGIKSKDLMLIPWRLVIALQDAGWYVRSIISWQKAAPMPESVTDRPTSAWEPIFLLTKKPNYYWDAEAVRVPLEGDGRKRGPSSAWTEGRMGYGDNHRGNLQGQDNPAGRNMWNYHRDMDDTLLLGPEPLAAEHYAAFPTAIPRIAVLAGTSERGVCATCGSPWKRLVEASGGLLGKGWTDHTGDLTKGMSQVYRADGGDEPYRRKTTGWQPSCRCNAGEPVPATVLDPFGGSGTSAMVANRLQRNAILCELSPVYADMARNRIIGDLGMLADVEVVTL